MTSGTGVPPLDWRSIAYTSLRSLEPLNAVITTQRSLSLTSTPNTVSRSVGFSKINWSSDWSSPRRW